MPLFLSSPHFKKKSTCTAPGFPIRLVLGSEEQPVRAGVRPEELQPLLSTLRTLGTSPSPQARTPHCPAVACGFPKDKTFSWQQD